MIQIEHLRVGNLINITIRATGGKYQKELTLAMLVDMQSNGTRSVFIYGVITTTDEVLSNWFDIECLQELIVRINNDSKFGYCIELGDVVGLYVHEIQNLYFVLTKGKELKIRKPQQNKGFEK